MNTYNRQGVKFVDSPQNIIDTYNHAVNLLAESIRAKSTNRENDLKMSLKDAGENFSQVIERAIKLHIKIKNSKNYDYYQNMQLPQAIKELYWDDNGAKEDMLWSETIIDIDSEVDFEFLANNKYLLTNSAKHKGGLVSFDIVNKYYSEIKKFIVDYIDNNVKLKTIEDCLRPEIEPMSRFYCACDMFNYEDRTYVLITDEAPHEEYLSFGKLKWSLIIEFNNNSEYDGLCASAYANNLNDLKKIKISDIVNDDDFTPYSDFPTVIFANGFRNEPKLSSCREWNKRNASRLETIIETFMIRQHTQKTIIVCVMQDFEYIRKLIDLCDRCLPNMAFIITNDNENNSLLANNDYTHQCPISISEIGDCFNTYILSASLGNTKIGYSLPCLDTASGLLSETEMHQLEETFEVLYYGVENANIDDQQEFLTGHASLSWYGAKNEFSARRDTFAKLYIKPLENVIKNGHDLFYIEHEPGFGGTTVARQIAWHFHNEYPVLILRHNRPSHIIEQLELIHNKTKKTILLFAEIPQTIDKDDFKQLYKISNESRPFIFIGIQRGGNNTNSHSLRITDWGNDVALLIKRFRPFLQQIPEAQRIKKEKELENILQGADNIPYKRTPFYIGLLSLEEKFEAVHSFISNFVIELNSNERQKKAIAYLTICDYYIDKALPASFLHTTFNIASNEVFKLDDFFSDSTGIVSSLLQCKHEGNQILWKIKHPFFTKELMNQLLGNSLLSNRKTNYPNLGIYCLDFINDIYTNQICNEEVKTSLLKDLFIGNTAERSGDRFNQLVMDIPKDERINIFTCLHELFPNNAHFCSHLARYYAIEEQNATEALLFADKAISICPEDPLLHHIKGICLRSIIYEKIIKCNNERIVITNKRQLYTEIIDDLLPRAAYEFELSRSLNKVSFDEFGYISHIEMLIRIFDFSQKFEQLTRAEIVANAFDPYVGWVDECHSLLETLSRYYSNGEVSERYYTCQQNLYMLYKDFSEIISTLNNQLNNSKNPQMVRRNIARTYILRGEYKNKEKTIHQITSLMEQNIKDNPDDERNFFLWFKAARHSVVLKTNDIIAKLSAWSSINPSLDVVFYCYVFNVLKAIDGSSEAAQIAMRLIEECKRKGGKNKIGIREWYGNYPQKIVNNIDILDETNRHDILFRMEGFISDYSHSGAATITIDCGLNVFFNPGKNNITRNNLNSIVTFNLGFSYDGLRADCVQMK